MNENFITTKEVARRLSLQPDTVLRWTAEGRIPCIRLSGSVLRFDWTAVRDALVLLGQEREGHASDSRSDSADIQTGGRHAR